MATTTRSYDRTARCRHIEQFFRDRHARLWSLVLWFGDPGGKEAIEQRRR
jgi:hypothetical protein